MIRFPQYYIRILFTFALFVLCATGTVNAQQAKINLDSLTKLDAKASETVDVALDENSIKLASKFLSDKKIDEAEVKKLISVLKGVYVKVFDFDRDDGYTKEDVDQIRSQLTGPGWARLVGVHSKKSDNVDVYMMTEADNIIGIAVIAASKRELVVVNIVGPIDLEKLSKLAGRLGIPSDLDIDIIKKP
jgi:hypothetical protein